MAITSKIQICNMALSHLGNYGTINDIDNPSGRNQKEVIFSLWYDICRQNLLRLTIPNFALARRVVSQLSDADVPPFGYAYAYEYPSDCLKVLGIGEIDDKDFSYTVEGNKILTDVLYEDGMELRFVQDITDVTMFSSDFKILLSWYLAAHVALDVTQDTNKKFKMEEILPMKMAEMSSLNAQENPPIRKSTSKFKQSRYTQVSRNNEKK